MLCVFKSKLSLDVVPTNTSSLLYFPPSTPVIPRPRLHTRDPVDECVCYDNNCTVLIVSQALELILQDAAAIKRRRMLLLSLSASVELMYDPFVCLAFSTIGVGKTPLSTTSLLLWKREIRFFF